jgi:hypothetical protein
MKKRLSLLMIMIAVVSIHMPSFGSITYTCLDNSALNCRKKVQMGFDCVCSILLTGTECHGHLNLRTMEKQERCKIKIPIQVE